MLNMMILQGRLTADIELKKTSPDVSNCEFTVAWSEKYKEVETKCFMRCKAWRGTADFLSKYFHKGSEILIQGKMVTEEWEKDGEKKSRTICVVENVNFCGKSDGAKPSSQVTGNEDFMKIDDSLEESLPFV